MLNGNEHLCLIITAATHFGSDYYSNTDSDPEANATSFESCSFFSVV